jgi:RNA polymerase sigma-70 factor (ECF subfamily)
MAAVAAVADEAARPMERAPLDFDAVYDAWFDQVVCWVRALDGRAGDADDLAQEVFLVVRRKLPAFDSRNLPAWLYRIAARTVSDHRRRAWFRHLWRRRVAVPLEELPALGADPGRALEQAEAQRLLQALLDRMSPKLRTTFILFEIEGYTGEEIAALEGIPAGTVRTRLLLARREFVRLTRHLLLEGK